MQLNLGANVTSSLYLTRGPHQDDVLRVQGTPSSINRYSDHEVWNYEKYRDYYSYGVYIAKKI